MDTSPNKKKVLLHYLRHGTRRSPNDQFDLLISQADLQEDYDLRVLDQAHSPGEIGILACIRELKRQIRAEKPDIVHISGVKEGFPCMIAAWLAGCKKRILITHGFAGLSMVSSFPRRMLNRWLIEPITLHLATEVQCNSQFSHDVQMVRLFARKKRFVVYNFLPPIKVDAPRWRESRGIPADRIVITTVGNMHGGKGYDIQETAARRLVECYGDRILFVTVGDGKLKADYDARCADLVASGHLLSLGSLPHAEAMQIVSESDIFLLPTRFETLGMVFAEAGYLGVPAVATSVGAVEEIVRDGETGLVIPPDDPDACTRALRALIDDPALRARLGSAARTRVRTVFSSAHAGREIRKLYER